MHGRTAEPHLEDREITAATQTSSPILAALNEIHDRCRRDVNGQVATYIPELAKAHPALFGIALATFSPRVAFGDLALLGGGRRTADVIADEPAVCYVLPADRLDALGRSHPAVRTRLAANLVREMAARLWSADAETRTLTG
jgi:CRP-like cAMP-binding protein